MQLSRVGHRFKCLQKLIPASQTHILTCVASSIKAGPGVVDVARLCPVGNECPVTLQATLLIAQHSLASPLQILSLTDQLELPFVSMLHSTRTHKCCGHLQITFSDLDVRYKQVQVAALSKTCSTLKPKPLNPHDTTFGNVWFVAGAPRDPQGLHQALPGGLTAGHQLVHDRPAAGGAARGHPAERHLLQPGLPHRRPGSGDVRHGAAAPGAHSM